MKKKNKTNTNYLEKCPIKNPVYSWKKDQNGIVTLEKENKGLFNLIAQKLFKKPKITYIHLDETGSFVWTMIDGEKTVIQISEAVEKEFGQKVYPLYERLAEYFRILQTCGFVILNK